MTIIEIPVTHTVDLRDLPAWLVQRGVTRAMEHCRPGDIVEVWSTDPFARNVMGSWLAAAGHRLIGIEARDGYDESFVEALQSQRGAGRTAHPKATLGTVTPGRTGAR